MKDVPLGMYNVKPLGPERMPVPLNDARMNFAGGVLW